MLLFLSSQYCDGAAHTHKPLTPNETVVKSKYHRVGPISALVKDHCRSSGPTLGTPNLTLDGSCGFPQPEPVHLKSSLGQRQHIIGSQSPIHQPLIFSQPLIPPKRMDSKQEAYSFFFFSSFFFTAQMSGRQWTELTAAAAITTKYI